ncbi:hypothetical protein BD779DRAFT_1680604 [Infundibulicybe gibba]|nr:hypothetical protein BD779DRAFT_1680604 [Infundibulicybe gibba]
MTAAACVSSLKFLVGPYISVVFILEFESRAFHTSYENLQTFCINKSGDFYGYARMSGLARRGNYKDCVKQSASTNPLLDRPLLNASMTPKLLHIATRSTYALALLFFLSEYRDGEGGFDSRGQDSGSNALTFGAGEQFADIEVSMDCCDIYKFADDNGLMVVGGSDESVGAAGGWGQGGGHSPLSPTLGLGVDRVLQYKVVTPDGVSRVANSCQNQDLFFALRGGGGGTFGVALEASIRATPHLPLQVANINWDISEDNYKSFLEVFIDNATTFAEQGWGGYVTPSIGNAILLTTRLNQAEANTSMKALIDRASTLGSKESSVVEIDSYWTWFQGYVEGKEGTQDAIGFPSVLSSRLILQANHATPEGRAQLVNLTVETNKQAFFSQIHFTTPYGYNGSTEGTSVTPA